MEAMAMEQSERQEHAESPTFFVAWNETNDEA